MEGTFDSVPLSFQQLYAIRGTVVTGHEVAPTQCLLQLGQLSVFCTVLKVLPDIRHGHVCYVVVTRK